MIWLLALVPFAVFGTVWAVAESFAVFRWTHGDKW